jgi:F0F1-type ATP synthase membrane subunit b/b'
MALSINLTLVVQAFHFMLAYWFISRVLLKPAYTVLDQEQKRLFSLRTQVVEEQERLVNKQEDKRKEWQGCQDYFHKQRPTLEKEIAPSLQALSITPIKPLASTEVNDVAREIASSLRSQVLHD